MILYVKKMPTNNNILLRYYYKCINIINKIAFKNICI